jgi:hypothetical protein
VNTIAVYHARAKDRLMETWGSDAVFDLTSKGPWPWVQFSPFYPHGDIPVPRWPGKTAASVEGIWQGLKRFEFEDSVDLSRFTVTTMRGLKRTSRAKGINGVPRGKVLGHQAGVDNNVLLDYQTARIVLYLPAYRWVLEHKVAREVALLREAAQQRPIFLIDYETNHDVHDLSRPLSHAALVRNSLLGNWPATDATQRTP